MPACNSLGRWRGRLGSPRSAAMASIHCSNSIQSCRLVPGAEELAQCVCAYSTCHRCLLAIILRDGFSVIFYLSNYSLDNVIHRFVLPKSQYKPIFRRQLCICISIADLVFLNFVYPPLTICLRDGGMPRTAMPKTAVAKYRNSCAWKCYVDRPSCVLNFVMDSESAAVAMQQ